MDIEFKRLAAARKIMGANATTGSLTRDRENAERWVRRFAIGAGDAAGRAIITRAHERLVVSPTRPRADVPAVFYIHGGGMVYYSAQLFGAPLAALANRLGTVVEALDYLKAPEHSVDESVRDLAARLAARCDAHRPREIVLAGDSVGGLLALYLAARVLPGVFVRLVLVYPMLDLRTERESYRQFGDGYFLDVETMRGFKEILLPYFAERDFDPFGMSDRELAALPPCSLVTAGCDVLRDEGLEWASHLRERGTDVTHQHFADLPHDFCLYSGKLTAARRAVDEMADMAFYLQEDRRWS